MKLLTILLLCLLLFGCTTTIHLDDNGTVTVPTTKIVIGSAFAGAISTLILIEVLDELDLLN